MADMFSELDEIAEKVCACEDAACFEKLVASIGDFDARYGEVRIPRGKDKERLETTRAEDAPVCAEASSDAGPRARPNRLI